MNKKFQILVLFALLTGFTCSYSIAQDDSFRLPNAGIGVSLFNSMDLISSFDSYTPMNLISFPVNLSNKLRIEPQIGLSLNSVEKSFILGFGAFGMSLKNKTAILYGVRLGYWQVEMLDISPTIGGEYFLSNHFSLGAEAQLKNMITIEDSEVYTFTVGTASIRFYF